MKLDTKVLRTALEQVQSVARMKSVNGAGLLHLSANGNNLALKCAAIGELTSYVEERVPYSEHVVKIDSVCLRFDYLLNALSDSPEVELRFEGSNLRVVSGSLKTNLTLADGNTFPAVPKIEAKPFGVQTSDLLDGIRAVHGMEHTDYAAEYIMSGLRVVGAPTSLTCEAGFRIALSRWQRPLMCPEFEILIPGRVVDLVIGALSREGAALSATDKLVTVQHATGWLMVPQIDGKYLNTSGIWNQNYEWLGTFNRTQLKSELNRISTYLDPNKAPRIELELGESGVSVSARGLDSETGNVIAGRSKVATLVCGCGTAIRCLSQPEDSELEIGIGESAVALRTPSKELTIAMSKMR